MKRYRIGFLLFVMTSVICLAAGFGIMRYRNRMLRVQNQAQREALVSTEAETREVVSQRKVEPRPETLEQEDVKEERTKQEESRDQEVFYLVAEDGFLLVFARDKKTICLYTHIPITDFPMREQGRLREGIWFSDMMEVFHYLESYTS